MKNSNLKNKIIAITILLLVVFSFSNKAYAALSIEVTKEEIHPTSITVSGKLTGMSAISIGDVYLYVQKQGDSVADVENSKTKIVKTFPDYNTFTQKSARTLTPATSYVYIITTINDYQYVIDYLSDPANANLTSYVKKSFTTLATEVVLKPLECKPYFEIDKNNPNSSLSPGAKYWFLPPEGFTYSKIWKGPYNTLSECQTALKIYDPASIGGAGTINTDLTYTPLAPLPDTQGGFLTTFDSAKTNAFGDYLNTIIRLFIGICAVLAMVMIVIGGIEYMTSELSGHKEEGKERITNAIFGLLIALGAFALLNTINPQLLDVGLSGLPKAEVSLEGGESNAPFVPIEKTSLQTLGINCPGTGGSAQLVSISKSFTNHSTYSMTKRNTYDAAKKTAYFDCSSYVAQVYTCAGLSQPGGNTSSIFGGETITIDGTKVNGTELKVGDLLGWKAGESKKYPNFGHVVMYIGGGNVIESHGPAEVINQAIRILPLTGYQTEFKHIKRII